MGKAVMGGALPIHSNKVTPIMPAAQVPAQSRSYEKWNFPLLSESGFCVEKQTWAKCSLCYPHAARSRAWQLSQFSVFIAVNEGYSTSLLGCCGDWEYAHVVLGPGQPKEGLQAMINRICPTAVFFSHRHLMTRWSQIMGEDNPWHQNLTPI